MWGSAGAVDATSPSVERASERDFPLMLAGSLLLTWAGKRHEEEERQERRLEFLPLGQAPFRAFFPAEPERDETKAAPLFCSRYSGSRSECRLSVLHVQVDEPPICLTRSMDVPSTRSSASVSLRYVKSTAATTSQRYSERRASYVPIFACWSWLLVSRDALSHGSILLTGSTVDLRRNYMPICGLTICLAALMKWCSCEMQGFENKSRARSPDSYLLADCHKSIIKTTTCMSTTASFYRL